MRKTVRFFSIILSITALLSACGSIHGEKLADYRSDCRICIIGDSVETEEAGIWPRMLREQIQFAGYTNLAVSGTCITPVRENSRAIASEERIAMIPDDTTLILVGGGTNDWLVNIPLEEHDGSESFTGAIAAMIGTLSERFPDATVLFMSNPVAMMPGREGFADSSGIYNGLGLSVGDYAAAMREVCEDCGVTYIPVFEECGITGENCLDYLLQEEFFDGNPMIAHPNDQGAERIYETVWKALTEYVHVA